MDDVYIRDDASGAARSTRNIASERERVISSKY